METTASPLPTMQHDPVTCPYCKTELDCSSPAFDTSARPGPGDLTICMDCGAVCIYGEGLRLLPFSKEEVRECPPEALEQMLRVVMAWVKVTGKRPRNVLEVAREFFSKACQYD